MERKIYWVAFNLVKGIGAVRLRSILNYFGDLESAWQAPAQALMQAGLSEKVAGRVIEVTRDQRPGQDKQLDRTAEY